MKIPQDDFVIKQCGAGHLEDILQLYRKALAELPSADILRENTPQMMEACLNPPHYTIGAWHGDVLAAFAVLYCPDGEEDLSHCLKTIDAARLKPANYKLCVVDKDFRGNGLQCLTGRILERHARDNGVGILCATVSPKNLHSISNVLRLGFTYDSTTEKYGFERNLYYKILSTGC